MSDETDSPEPDALALGRYPPAFSSWPHADQITHVEMTMTRRGLIASILNNAGLSGDQTTIADDRKLTKKELAAVYLTLEGVSNAGN